MMNCRMVDIDEVYDFKRKDVVSHEAEVENIRFGVYRTRGEAKTYGGPSGFPNTTPFLAVKNV